MHFCRRKEKPGDFFRLHEIEVGDSMPLPWSGSLSEAEAIRLSRQADQSSRVIIDDIGSFLFDYIHTQGIFHNIIWKKQW